MIILRNKQFGLRDRFELARKIYKKETDPKELELLKGYVKDTKTDLEQIPERDFNKYRTEGHKLSKHDEFIEKKRAMESTAEMIKDVEKRLKHPKRHALKSAISGAFLKGKSVRNDWRSAVGDYGDNDI
jgi:hypothetical protein